LLAATPRHTDPAASLQPVPQAVLDAAMAEVAAADAAWGAHG
jgi:peptide/nickel transport system ATP-binding protein